MAEFKHRKLEIWQTARLLVKDVYLLRNLQNLRATWTRRPRRVGREVAVLISDATRTSRPQVLQVSLLTKGFPSDERFSLTDQIRRAVVSVPSNIAEGSCRGTPSDFAHFLSIARGSLAEVDTQLTSIRISAFMSHLRRASKHPTL